MKRPVNLGIASLKALLMVVVLGTVAHGSLPYLPLIGPPPLRIQTVKAPAEAGLHARRKSAETSRRTGSDFDEIDVDIRSPLESVSVRHRGAGENKLLLIGGRYFLVEVVEVRIILGIEQREVVGERAGHIHTSCGRN